MKRHARTAALVALTLAVLGGATYTFVVLHDPPQRPAARVRPPSAPSIGQAVPRPHAPGRGTAPTTGQAVPRQVPPRGVGPAVPGRVIHPYYVYPGFSVGFWYTWPYPYGYAAYGYPPYAYPWPEYPLAVPDTGTGSVRLDVSPKDAAVYVDGDYAGIVDDFNGVFHHLTLTAGPHMIEVRKTGLETLTVAIFVQPDQTITYRAAMLPAQSGSVGEEIGPGSAQAPTAGAALPGPPGDLRFDVTPKDAQVYVDGYYVGIVDDFGGRHQHLNLMPGAHHIELQAQGYEPVEVDVTIQSRQTTTYRGALIHVKSGS